MGETVTKNDGINRAKLYQLVLFPLNNGATNVYYVLEPHVYPPEFKKIKACNYHRYTDDHPDLSTDDEDE